MDTIVPHYDGQRTQRSCSQLEKIQQIVESGEIAPGTSLKAKTNVLHLREQHFLCLV